MFGHISPCDMVSDGTFHSPETRQVGIGPGANTGPRGSEVTQGAAQGWACVRAGEGGGLGAEGQGDTQWVEVCRDILEVSKARLTPAERPSHSCVSGDAGYTVGQGLSLGSAPSSGLLRVESCPFAAACPGQCQLWVFRSFSCFFWYLGWGRGWLPS